MIPTVYDLNPKPLNLLFPFSFNFGGICFPTPMSLTLKPLDEGLRMAQPERQYQFVLIYCQTGHLTIDIDDQMYTVGAQQFLTITPKQFYQFIAFNDCNGYVLAFTYNFFCKDDKCTELIYHNGLFCHFGLNETIQIPHSTMVEAVERHFSAIHYELTTQAFEWESSMHALLKLLLIEVSRCKIIQQRRPLYQPSAVFLQFLNLVRDSFEQRLSIGQYASELNMTEQKLNELAKKNTGETTQQLINDLIILEAKRLFQYENLNVKQVAYKLGFTDEHYFSRFFKKQTSTRAKDHLRSLLTD